MDRRVGVRGARRVVGFGLALAVVSAVVVACGRSGVPGDPGPARWPAGRTFLSTSVTESGAERPLVAGTRVRLTFSDDGQLSAHAGCNYLSAPGRLDGDRLVLGELSTTKKACEQPLMDQDTWLAGFLIASPTLRLTGDELTLSSGSTTMRLADRRIIDP